MAPRYLCLQNGTIIDGTGGDPLERGSVLIERDRIVSVGGVDDVRFPPQDDVRIVDVTDKTLMPGMVDCHFHGAYQDVTCWEDYDLRRSIEHTTIFAARNAQTLVEVGFTSARDTGTRGLIALAVRDMINAGLLVGPRLMAGGRGILTSTGGLVDGYGYWVENRAGLGEIVDGVDAVVRAVRDQIKYGADNVKIEASGTGISPYSNSRKQTMTVEEMTAVVAEAHRNGVRVACHAQATEGIKNAVRAGVDTVEHGSFLDEEGAALMVEAGTILVPTISVLHLYVHRGPDVGVPEWVVDKFRGDLDEHMESVRLALAKKIPMAVGSDSGHRFNPQSDIAIELEIMVETGFTPMQAIEAATRVGAGAIGLGDQVGRLAPGMMADLLVIDGEPLSDISVLRQSERLNRVYKGGKLVAGSEAPRRSELELGYELGTEPLAVAADTQGTLGSEADAPCCLKPSDELEDS